MSDGEFEDVCFFQFGDVFSFGLERGDHEVFEFVEAAVDACSALAFEHGFHDFSVLVGAGDGFLVGLRVRGRVVHAVRRHSARGKDHGCGARGGLRASEPRAASRPLLCALYRLWQNARDKNRGGTVGTSNYYFVIFGCNGIFVFCEGALGRTIKNNIIYVT